MTEAMALLAGYWLITGHIEATQIEREKFQRNHEGTLEKCTGEQQSDSGGETMFSFFEYSI